MSERTNLDPQNDDQLQLDLIGMLRRRKWIAIVMTGIGVAAGWYYYTHKRPEYQSLAQLMIFGGETAATPQDLPLRGIDRQTGFEQAELSSQIFLLKSPRVLEAAARDPVLRDFATLKEGPDRTATLMSLLDVYPARLERGGTAKNVLELSLRSHRAEECAVILQAILSSYQSFIGETRRDVGKDTIALLNDAKTVLKDELSAKEDEYRNFRENSPVLLAPEGQQSGFRAYLAELEQARSRLTLQKAEKAAQLATIVESLDSGASQEFMLLLIREIAGTKIESVTDPTKPTKDVEERLLSALLEEMSLKAKVGANNPSLKAVRDRIEFLRSQQEQSATPEGTQNDATASYIQGFIEALKKSEGRLDKELRDLDVLIAAQQAAVKGHETIELEDRTRRNDIERTRRLFEGVVTRFEELNLVSEKQTEHSVVISPPSYGTQVAPKMLICLPVGGGLGLILGLFVMLLQELADTRFRSPADISRTFGAPVLGHVSFLTGRSKVTVKSLGPELIAIHAPASEGAESIRVLRTSLASEIRRLEARTLLVTSPLPGDGKSTISMNLAISFAQAGKKALLIDADLRRARVHKAFGLKRGPGLSDLISGNTSYDDALQPTACERLSLLGAGTAARNPSELLASAACEEVLRELRGMFDIIIIDSAPILPVADSGGLSAHVDATVVVLRLRKGTRQNAMAARQLLDSFHARPAGVIINNPTRKRNPGYLAGYGYAQQYGYRYGGSSAYRVNGSSPVMRFTDERSARVADRGADEA